MTHSRIPSPFTSEPVSGPSPVLSPDALRAIALEVLGYTSGDTSSVRVEHRAKGTAHVTMGRVHLNDSGDEVVVTLTTNFGQRGGWLRVDQLDSASLRDAVAYLDQLAYDQPGDPTSLATSIPPRHYLPNTTWKEKTVDAFFETRHTVMPVLVTPLLEANLTVAAFAGVYARSTVYAEKTGIIAAGQETDTEITVTGYSADDKGSGWAGQAARDWSTLTPDVVAQEALRLTQRSANPVALEPGRRLAILDRPAVAQLVHGIGIEFWVQFARTPGHTLFNESIRGPKLGERVLDGRVSVSSDPNDPDAGFLPFNPFGSPLIPMSWIENGVFTHLAWDAGSAARNGIVPPNDPPRSLRFSGGPTSVDEMIANCKEGIYVRRFAQVQEVDRKSGMMTGVTTGGCFLVRNGKIDKPVKNFRFMASPWIALSKLEAIGPTERTAFGYAPWAGDWPIEPVIVPPVMVRDFNFVALAEAV